MLPDVAWRRRRDLADHVLSGFVGDRRGQRRDHARRLGLRFVTGGSSGIRLAMARWPRRATPSLTA
jgi:hypothetical protein